MSDAPPSSPRPKRAYEPPRIEVVVLSTEESLLGVCMVQGSCGQPFTQSAVVMPVPPRPEPPEDR